MKNCIYFLLLQVRFNYLKGVMTIKIAYSCKIQYLLLTAK